jgi:predicted Zn-dependent protease with MMP-like domain
MNITTSYLLYKIYPTFQHAITPPEFLKMCYNIIINIEDFKPIKKYIDDLFDTNTPPKSIRKINGRSKKVVVDNFLESNKMLLISELTVRI